MSIDDNNFTKAELAAMRAQPASAEVCAEQHARRFYRKDHFVDQVTAERAYFRVLAESLARGQQIADLSRKLGKARRRANDLRRSNEDLRRELFEAATPKLFHASVVTDKPDHPVSAVCVLEGCQELAHEAAWRPIADVPDDVDWIIGAWPWADFIDVGEAWRDAPNKPWIGAFHDEPVQPTHWMPLPALPRPRSARGDD